MLTIEEIRLKAEALDQRAATADDIGARAYREIATQWRLLEVHAVFMDAIRDAATPACDPPA